MSAPILGSFSLAGLDAGIIDRAHEESRRWVNRYNWLVWSRGAPEKLAAQLVSEWSGEDEPDEDEESGLSDEEHDRQCAPYGSEVL
jgi:hypothetical protein